MKPTAYDFKEFYGTPTGAVVQSAITSAIQKLWPDTNNRRVAVFGYADCYAPLFTTCERTVFFMPPDQGAYPWPAGDKNRVVISARTALPLETNSLDGVILVHSLEFTNAIEPHLNEIWRVLKSQGRLMIIVPNRLGFWARVDWAPFGEGSPYSLSQLQRYLRAALFIPERHMPILFALPLRWRIAQKIAPYLERFMPYIAPALGGLQVVEASKQVYAGLALPVKPIQRVPAGVLVGEPKGTP